MVSSVDVLVASLYIGVVDKYLDELSSLVVCWIFTCLSRADEDRQYRSQSVKEICRDMWH